MALRTLLGSRGERAVLKDEEGALGGGLRSLVMELLHSENKVEEDATVFLICAVDSFSYGSLHHAFKSFARNKFAHLVRAYKCAKKKQSCTEASTTQPRNPFSTPDKNQTNPPKPPQLVCDSSSCRSDNRSSNAGHKAVETRPV